jgi:hypothetical protein
MRLLCFVAMLSLVGCADASVKLSLDKCPSISIRDHVQGTAILHAYAGGGCIECGAYITSKACSEMTDFALADGPVNDAYDDLLKSSRAGANGYVQRTVYLAGDVIPNGATGKPMVRANVLRPIGI